MDDHNEFLKMTEKNVACQGADVAFRAVTDRWIESSVENKYTYNFTWMGRPIIQYPQDILAVQEIIFKVRPEIIIETGIARGGR